MRARVLCVVCVLWGRVGGVRLGDEAVVEDAGEAGVEDLEK